jgi:p-aminobenzoyl-glutamate transporter AbgT
MDYALHTLWFVIRSNWWMMLILVGLLVFKVIGPQLRKYWKGGL